MIYKLKHKKTEEIAKDTIGMYFEKPEGFDFSAGQSMRFVYPELNNESRTFTIASAPHEDDLFFAMRKRRSMFKKKLSSLKPGDTVEVEGPLGERFILHEDESIPAVFIAGGVGITPLYSMLKDIIHKGKKYHVTLLYSNRREEDIAFLDEVKKIDTEYENIKVVCTMTRDFKKDPNWEGERAYVDVNMVKKYVSDIATPLFYISGSPMMVVSMKEKLELGGVSADHIVTKKFTGY